MRRLFDVAPDKLPEQWDWIARGLEICIRKSRARGSVDDVLGLLQSNKARLYLIVDDDVRGFVVLQQMRDADCMTLYVQAIYGRLADIEGELWDELEAFAKACGCERMRWESGRNWKGRGRAVRTVYERELS